MSVALDQLDALTRDLAATLDQAVGQAQLLEPSPATDARLGVVSATLRHSVRPRLATLLRELDGLLAEDV